MLDPHPPEGDRDFLLRLSDTIRVLDEPEAIQRGACSLLAEYLELDSVSYVQVYGDEFTAQQLWSSSGELSAGDGRLSDLGSAIVAALRGGESVAISDVATDPRVDGAPRVVLQQHGIQAFVSAPIRNREDRIDLFGWHVRRPREWLSSDIDLAHQVGERVWFAVDRARSDAALKASEARFRGFADASSNGVWIADLADMHLDYANAGLAAILGLEDTTMLASPLPWREAVIPADRDRFDAYLEQLRQGQRATCDYAIRRPDGSLRYLLDTGFMLAADAPLPVRIGGIVQDLTDRHLAEKRLRDGEERLLLALKTGRMGTWDWDMRTDTITWSEEHFLLQGYKPFSVEPSYAAWVAGIHPDDRSSCEQALLHARDTHTPYQQEFRSIHADGSIHWCAADGHFFYENDVPVRMIGVMHEVTEQRELRDRQQVLIAELQHRTRNLLGVVGALVDKMLRRASSLDEFAIGFGQRLGALSRAQGLLSRLGAGERVTFDALIALEVQAMNGSPDRVTLDGPDDVRLRSNSVQMLALAMHELATNALKYGALRADSGTLAVHWRRQDRDGQPWLRIEWIERGVAKAANGSLPAGQGRELIERALPYQLGAQTSYQFGDGEVRCTIEMPLDRRS